MDGQELKEKGTSSLEFPSSSSHSVRKDNENDLPEGTNLEERARSVLEMGLWADCTFIVGKEKEKVRANQNFLAVASPVFGRMFQEIRAKRNFLAIAELGRMFFGQLAETGPVLIPDMEPAAFKKLLEFIYTHKLPKCTFHEARQVAAAAHKYKMPDLMHSCIPFLMPPLEENYEHILSALNLATLYSVNELKEKAIQKIQKNTVCILKTPDFLNLSSESLVAILQRGYLSVDSELQLIESATNWATVRCKEKNLPVTGSNLRSVLIEAGVFKCLRFLTLSPDELVSCIEKTGIITRDDITVLESHINSFRDIPLPDDLCYTTKCRKNKDVQHAALSGRVRKSQYSTNICTKVTKTEIYEIGLGKPVVLVSLSLPAQMKSSCDNVSYEEDLQVEIWKLENYTTHSSQQSLVVQNYNTHSFEMVMHVENKRELLIASGNFKGEVKYNSEIKIPLQMTSIVQTSVTMTKGNMFYVHITFNKSGTYPTYNTAYDSLYGYDATSILMPPSNSQFKCHQAYGHVIEFGYRN